MSVKWGTASYYTSSNKRKQELIPLILPLNIPTGKHFEQQFKKPHCALSTGRHSRFQQPAHPTSTELLLSPSHPTRSRHLEGSSSPLKQIFCKPPVAWIKNQFQSVLFSWRVSQDSYPITANYAILKAQKTRVQIQKLTRQSWTRKLTITKKIHRKQWISAPFWHTL